MIELTMGQSIFIFGFYAMFSFITFRFAASIATIATWFTCSIMGTLYILEIIGIDAFFVSLVIVPSIIGVIWVVNHVE